MPKNKRPVPRKASAPVQEDDDVLAQALADLALDVAEQEDDDAEAVRVKRDELHRLVRNALRKKNDEVLYGAIERARFTDVGAYQLLREEIGEAGATVVMRREGSPAMEINAFMLPLIVHSHGGLQEALGFQDGAAFDELVASFQRGGLESADAKVVLISHAYDFGEIDRITYSNLNDMLRDAAASMSERKLVATPAIERSIVGWDASNFGADDTAVELRFLLGFSLKRADDPFYQQPPGEDAADAWFDARMTRYAAWTEQAAPLVARCLGGAPTVHFLYQDLFFGAKQQGMDELATLQLMAGVNAALAGAGVAASAASAIVGPAVQDDELVLRVRLSAGGALLATLDKPLDVAAALEADIDDLRDALATVGVVDVSVADN